jgi:large subunit ribosomal protein L18
MAKKIIQIKRLKRVRRHNKIRKSISGNSTKPRLSVFRSHSHIYAQLIDDSNNKTLICASDLELKIKGKKVDKAKAVGELLAKKAKEVKIKRAIFDRGGFKYHGRVKNLADGAREAGLII